LEDEGDDDLPCPDWALVGKILTPNTLHINTITSVVRPAWGNPKGLMVRPMGPNLFLAEFGSEVDRSRVMKGGPWCIGKHAILLKEFDPRIKPEEVVFDELMVWARIMNLGYELMNSERGKPLASRLGTVDTVDVDENGRAWGSYLRVRVSIDASQPIMRCISAYSKKKNQTVQYDVMYEKLPIFCFSCGLLGHSSLLCPTPAARDADGKLPYNGERLCVPDPKKKERGASSNHPQSSRGSWSGTDRDRGSGSFTSAPDGRKKKDNGKGEESPLMKTVPRARRAPTVRKGAQADLVNDAGMVGEVSDKNRLVGLKRKQIKTVYRVKVPEVVTPNVENTGILTITSGNLLVGGISTSPEGDPALTDSHKKQKIDSRSADLAAAALQPRPTR
jgi:hypothetical protein